jgi:hypothetical protein
MNMILTPDALADVDPRKIGITGNQSMGGYLVCKTLYDLFDSMYAEITEPAAKEAVLAMMETLQQAGHQLMNEVLLVARSEIAIKMHDGSNLDPRDLR